MNLVGYVIQHVESGQYVGEFDPDFGPSTYPNGLIVATPDIDKAIVYPSSYAAVEAYRTASTTVPLRPDGRPNRPMTNLTVAFVAVYDGSLP